MTSSLRDNLILQVELFETLELQAEQDYGIMEAELSNVKFKELVGHIRSEEMYHAKLCREIIDFLKNSKHTGE